MATTRNQNTPRAADPVRVNRPERLSLPSMRVEESKTVPDGAHLGTIADVVFSERGEEGFPYVDVHVKEAESGVVLKAGYAASRITPETELGRLLRRFGAPVKPGEDVDWAVLTEAGQVAFTTETERKKNGKFARVILESLKPSSD